ncbi:hypothetical protein K443DRAFT_680496 [Laccaria amethystina LaAM-08-1]|uniref:DUF6534 domain-containing protein n=1 Tax=Laccaria amethystina LaAM-08-1 TaxID=1095629 RepID=A0A0C9XS33_9AGAR|nr:hypothetical protein K443DRAFT_680496 [Laccaria amethystina LaAM-08-1]
MGPLESTIGFLLSGVLFTTFMFGIVTVQTYIYFSTFRNDRRILKWLISLIWFLELGTMLCISIGTYTIFVTNFGHPERLARNPDPMNSAVLVGGLVDHLVKAIFIYRLYRFSSKLLICIALWGLSLFLFSIIIISTTRALRPGPLKPRSEIFEWLLSVTFLGSAVQDLCIAGSMCYYLRGQRRGLTKSTTLLLDKLFAYSIQTGLATSLVAVAAAVSFLSMREIYVWMMFYMLMHTFFSNALLSSLNNRAGLISSTNQVMNFTGDLNLTSATAGDRITFAPVNMDKPGYHPTFSGLTKDSSTAEEGVSPTQTGNEVVGM